MNRSSNAVPFGLRGRKLSLAARALVAVSVAAAVGSPVAMAADSCPNAALRTGVSAALPDCRAYELVSPDLNHASLSSGPSGYALSSGDTMMYYSVDAPSTANFGSVYNFVVAKRNPVTGWSGASLNPPLHGPTAGYFANITQYASADLTLALATSDQSPGIEPAPPGQHLWLTHSDGTFDRLDTVGNPFMSGIDFYEGWGTIAGYNNLRDVFFQPSRPQLPSDPTGGGNTYHWSNGRLSLLGILPGETPAPFGASVPTTTRDVGDSTPLPPVSADGSQALFNAAGDPALYLRSNDAETVDVGASQRTVDPDPNPLGVSLTVGVTPDAKQVIFASRSELTDDAYTGRTGGVATDAGNDLYSYDIASGTLTDLTVDRDPADAATGANVKSIVAVTADGSALYFTATGNLAPGASPGHTSLYVLRGRRIDFVANADGLVNGTVSADGSTIALTSTDRLTNYDNTDPSTGQPHQEVYVTKPGQAVVCTSCRPDGSRPTANSYLTGHSPYVKGTSARVITDDGGRVFFESADDLIPQVSNDLTQVYQYAQGAITAISPGGGRSKANFLDASGSGNDVFFTTYDQVVPNPNGGDSAVIDARVNGGFAQPVKEVCDGAACAPAGTPPPVLPTVGTVTFLGDGNIPEVTDPATGKVSAAKTLSVKGTRASLKVKVPAEGKVTVSGSGLKSSTRTASKAQTLTVTVALSSKTAKTLKQGKSVRIKAKVSFAPSGGSASSVTVALTFKPATTKKGR